MMDHSEHVARSVTVEERRARLMLRHRLAPSARGNDITRIADGLLALHSSDPVSVHLSATSRMRTPSIAAVEAALYEDRALVRLHAMRRTLWVATPPVARLAHASSTPKIAAAERRRLVKLLQENGIGDGDAWLEQAAVEVLAVLDGLGEATARELGEAVPGLRHPLVLAPGKKYGQTISAHTRVLLQLGLDGELLRTRPVGSWVSGQYRWAHATRWIHGGIAGPEPREAAAEIACRWLHAFGPAPASDLQWWTGWTKRDTTTALGDAGAVAVAVEGTDEDAWLAPDDTESVTDSEPWVALLPGLDPTTMGWKDRDWYLDPRHVSVVFDRNGNAGPTVWVDGRVVGAWAQRHDGSIALLLLERLPKSRRADIDAAAEHLRSVIGDTRISVRFPAPADKQLLGATPA